MKKHEKVEYNESGIFINDKNEYGSLQKTIVYLQSQNLLKKKGIDYLENGNYWYIILSKSFASFIVLSRIELTPENVIRIKNIEELVKND